MATGHAGGGGAIPKTSHRKIERWCMICGSIVAHTRNYVSIVPRTVLGQVQLVEKYAAKQKELNRILNVADVLQITKARELCGKCDRRLQKVAKAKDVQEEFQNDFWNTQSRRGKPTSTPTETPTKPGTGGQAKRLSATSPSTSHRPAKRTALDFEQQSSSSTSGDDPQLKARVKVNN